jgi:hypothetical protein
MDPSNPVTLLVPLIGVAVILAAVWLTGGARRVRLDRALVLARLGEDLPDFVAAEVAIDADGAAALIHGAEGALAIVFAAGDKVVVRALEPGEVRHVEAAGDRLAIDTTAFTHERFTLTLPGAAATWARRLAAAERAA